MTNPFGQDLSVSMFQDSIFIFRVHTVSSAPYTYASSKITSTGEATSTWLTIVTKEMATKMNFQFSGSLRAAYTEKEKKKRSSAIIFTCFKDFFKN